MRLIVNIEGKEPRIVDVTAEVFTVGRSPKNSIQIRSDSVSRSHIRIRASNNVVYVTDLGSANGTYIDNEMLIPNVETPWHTFYPISFGGGASLAFDATLPELDFEKKMSRRAIAKNRKKIRNGTQTNIKIKLKNKNVESKKKSFKYLFIGLVLLLGMGFFFFYYYKDQNFKGTDLSPTPPTPNLPASKIVPNDIVKIPSTLMEWDKCQDEKEQYFCKSLKITPEYAEGAILKDNDLFIYFNFGERIKNSEIEPTFSFANDYNRITFLMAYLAFKEDIRLGIERFAFNNLLMVDISVGPTKVNRVMKISRENLLKLPLTDVQKIFAGVINKDPKLFNFLLLRLVEMGSPQ